MATFRGGRNISFHILPWNLMANVVFFKLEDGFQIFTMEKCLEITISLHPFKKTGWFKYWSSRYTFIQNMATFLPSKTQPNPQTSMEISKKLERYCLQGGVVICQQTLELRWLFGMLWCFPSWLVATYPLPVRVPRYHPKKINKALLSAYENQC